MIEKIVKIHNVGRFHDFDARGDITFRKLNLIFGNNGKGKTTLNEILRSLKHNNSNIILGRKTLGSDNDPQVIIKTEQHPRIAFQQGRWSQQIENIDIFDENFINKNLYSGESIDHEHRKNLNKIVIGNEGVRLRNKIDALTNGNRRNNDKIKYLKDEISKYIPDDMSEETFLKLRSNDRIDTYLEKHNRDLSALESSKEILDHDGFTQIENFKSPCLLVKTLLTTIDDISKDTKLLVEKHIQKHSMENGGEEWLREGLKWSSGDNCPFCGQSMITSDIYHAIVSFFGKEYSSHIDTISTIYDEFESFISAINIDRITDSIQHNNSNIEFWSKHITTDVPLLGLAQEIRSCTAKLKSSTKKLFELKTASPLEEVQIDDNFKSYMTQLGDICTEIIEYNETITAANNEIDEIKNKILNLNLEKTKKKITILESCKTRNEIINSECEEYISRIHFKNLLSIKKSEINEELSAYSLALFGTHHQNINRFLTHFSTGFTISNLHTNNRGGTPNTSFGFTINRNNVSTITNSDSSPCFKNTLSMGDKRALALAFFLSIVSSDSDLESKIIIFDDPFSSLDRFRRQCTRDNILGLLDRCKQIIVFSHDDKFLKLIGERQPARYLKTLKLKSHGSKTTIEEWDMASQPENNYERDLSLLRSYASEIEENQSPLEVARAIRPALESHFRYEAPGIFSPNDFIRHMIEKIDRSNSVSPLFVYKSHLEDLIAIKEYTNPQAHGEEEYTSNPDNIDDDELRGYVNRALQVIDCESEN